MHDIPRKYLENVKKALKDFDTDNFNEGETANEIRKYMGTIHPVGYAIGWRSKAACAVYMYRDDNIVAHVKRRDGNVNLAFIEAFGKFMGEPSDY